MKLNKPLITVFLFLIGVITYTKLLYNTPAPNVTFTTLKNEKIELAKLHGKPVIVTFWASDCANCIKEMQHLIDLHDKFNNKGLQIIAVAMYYDIPSHVVEITKAKQLPYSIALDLKGEHANAFNQVELIPATFLISATGKIIMQTTGLFNIEIMQQKIEKILQG
jgi:peroxiredoxin